MTWASIETAPRDGRVFLGANDAGVIFTVCVVKQKQKTTVTRGWFWRKRVETEPGGDVLYGACPSMDGNGYNLLALRGDWEPTRWMHMPASIYLAETVNHEA